MQIRWVPFSEVSARHLRMLAASLHAAPEAVRHSGRDFLQRLAARELRMFEFEGGLIVVHKERTRLLLDAMYSKKGYGWLLVPALRQIAADWECDTVQTTVFDRRLADAIKKLGGEIESYDLVLPVAERVK